MKKCKMEFRKEVNGGKAIAFAKKHHSGEDRFLAFTMLKGIGFPLDSILDMRHVVYFDNEETGMISVELKEINSFV